MPLSIPSPNLGGGYIPPDLGQSAQQQIEDMKKFMSKDVVELAAALPTKEHPFSYDVVTVRGKKLVVPKAPAARSVPATTIACLFALDDRKVDRVLHALKAQANFIDDDGNISNRPIIECLGTTGDVPHDMAVAVQPTEQPRNILLEDDRQPFEQKYGQVVAVLGVDGVTPLHIGVIWTWDIRQSPRSHAVKVLGADLVEVAESRLVKIDTMDDLVELHAKVKQQ